MKIRLDWEYQRGKCALFYDADNYCVEITYPPRLDSTGDGGQAPACANANLDTILLDHSHCERKAAGVALNLMFRYPSSSNLVRKRILDSLLVAGLIEARSHARLGLLAMHCPCPELAQFYSSLMASQARHYGIY